MPGGKEVINGLKGETNPPHCPGWWWEEDIWISEGLRCPPEDL